MDAYTDTTGRSENPAGTTRARLRQLGVDELSELMLEVVGDNIDAIDRLQQAVQKREGAPEPSPVQEPESEQFMVGSSPAMRRVFDRIRRFGATDAPVLVLGESGTGKELAARAIHERSRQANAPFVAINCAGLPSSLIASELFGHEKGAFTGATQRRIGRIEAAAGGTVLLDEIGDIPIELQPYLLRFLEEKTIDRVGGTHPIEVDVRVVAATNTDLKVAIEEGRFREDLFYRLNVLTLELPALRERSDDISLISRFFLEKFAREMGREDCRFSDSAMAAIRSHVWPGNVRELISRVRQGVVMSEDGCLTVEDLGLPQSVAPIESVSGSDDLDSLIAQVGTSHLLPILDQARYQLEGKLLRRALDQNNENVKKAAQDLGVSRVTLYRLMEKHGIQRTKTVRAATTR